MLLTDPPYNVNYGAVRDVSEAVKRNKRTDGLLIQDDNMGDEEFREFLTSAFRNANAVMRPGAVFYIWHADGEGYVFRGACRDVGWTGSMSLACMDGKMAQDIYGQATENRQPFLILTDRLRVSCTQR